jgi:8-oxo-dGTP diphosphatase
MPEFVHVAVGIIRNDQEKVLISLRNKNQHQGGLWEFPGGKVEVGESLSAALSRELQEELDLEVLSSSPLLKVEHDYGDKRVLLDVCLVESFYGRAIGKEGQTICWVSLKELDDYEFPQANLEIVRFLQEY